jgi:hypothetical protein
MHLVFLFMEMIYFLLFFLFKVNSFKNDFFRLKGSIFVDSLKFIYSRFHTTWYSFYNKQKNGLKMSHMDSNFRARHKKI